LISLLNILEIKMYKKVVLENGLRIITVPIKSTGAVTILILTEVGSKYETREVNGISHFIEHMIFKGTQKRPTTQEESSALDRVGGEYNAFTGGEFTGYWAKVDAKHLDLALDWISDIFLNSKFDEKEIEREKGVIIEEINMRLDMPTSYVFDLWDKLLYQDQPAGWPISGEKETVAKLEKGDFFEYSANHYSSRNTVVCLAGNFESKIALEKAKKYFKKIRTNKPKQKLKVIEKQSKPQVLNYFKETDQTHFCLGVRGYDLFHPQRYTQGVIATILGGPMSSRLFISVRDKHGLAYYIHTLSDSSTDTGCLVTHAGVDNKNVDKALELILKEYKSLKEGEIDKEELQKAKDYLKGRLYLALESSEAQASFYTNQELLTRKILTPEEEVKKIDKVTLNDIRKVAQDIFRREKLNLASIGPAKEKETYLNILENSL